MRIGRDEDGAQINMSHTEYAKLHSFFQLAVELAANEVFNGSMKPMLPDFLADGPEDEDKQDSSFLKKRDANERFPTMACPGAPGCVDPSAHDAHLRDGIEANQIRDRRLDWLEGMYPALDKRVKIAENDLDSVQGEEANHTAQTITELSARIAKLESRFNPVEGRGSAGEGVTISHVGQGGAGWGRAGGVTGFAGGGGGTGEANAALNFASMSGRLPDPLAQAEARVREYMKKSHFSAATILGVVDAIRGE